MVQPTDSSALAASKVTEIHMVGRRGPSQARFTTKELRELGALPDTEVVVDPEELALDPAYVDPSAERAQGPLRRHRRDSGEHEHERENQFSHLRTRTAAAPPPVATP